MTGFKRRKQARILGIAGFLVCQIHSTSNLSVFLSKERRKWAVREILEKERQDQAESHAAWAVQNSSPSCME